MPTRLPGLLREVREQRGSSLRSAARDLGVDPAYLSRVERGEKPASATVLSRAANYYDIPLDDLAPPDLELPEDVVEILLKYPEALDELRRTYGSR